MGGNSNFTPARSMWAKTAENCGVPASKCKNHVDFLRDTQKGLIKGSTSHGPISELTAYLYEFVLLVEVGEMLNFRGNCIQQ